MSVRSAQRVGDESTEIGLPERLRQEVISMKDAAVEREFWDQIRGESKSPDAEHVGVEALAQGSTRVRT